VKKLLLDSGIVSDFINRRRSIYERVKEVASQKVRIGTCIPVLAEITFGIEASKSREQNMRRFLGALPSFVVWPFDLEAAFRYGVIAAELRRNGRPMQSVDIMIGAIALNLGDCKVVTTDSDLLAIPGLVVERW
jgi:tRNA(fMet)-specific endonuclease VapC